MEFNNNLVLLAIAVFTLANTIFGWWDRRETRKVVDETRAIALKTELNTNSMKDALVKATATASFAEGHEVAREEGEKKATTLEAGRVAGAAQEKTK